MLNEDIRHALCELASETGALWTPRQIQRIREPTALEFMRFVATSTPVIIQGVVSGWDAYNRWSLEYLKTSTGNRNVNVNVTPNGLGDAVLHVPTSKYANEYVFIKPEEREMNFTDFANLLESKQNCSNIPYLSYQNDSLRTEFPEISSDVPDNISWATKAFGTPPDAVNLWVGDCRATTSVHADHYENLYCVIKGYKDFILLPPAAAPFLYEKKYSPARYHYDKSELCWKIVLENGEKVPWCSVDPHPDYLHYPNRPKKQFMALECRLMAGEILYLPAMWYHRVAQSKNEATIAVNYWHDMQFNAQYVYASFVKAIGKVFTKHEAKEAQKVQPKRKYNKNLKKAS
eukprot:GSMAST32.ASY1.ANO1.345.1 assembled CDS